MSDGPSNSLDNALRGRDGPVTSGERRTGRASTSEEIRTPFAADRNAQRTIPFESAGHLPIDSISNTQSGRTASAVGGGSGHEASSVSDQHGMDNVLFEPDLVQKLDSIVDAFKAGTINQARATAGFIRLLPSVESGDQCEAAATALDSYLSIISNHEDLTKRAGERGELQRGATPDVVELPSKSKRLDRPSSKDFDDEGIESDPESDSGSRSNKKQRLYEHELPWYPNDLIAQSIIRPELQKTQATIRLFSKDFSATKRFITSSLTVPEFPDAEWDNVIRGRPVNINTVFSSINAISPAIEYTESIGSYKIKFSGSTASTKKVQNLGDWIMAWGLVTRATLHAFPHRDRELREYGEYIVRLFGAISQSEAARVILLDEAIRTFVGGRNDLLLTDYASFEHLKITCLSNYGANQVTVSKSPKASRQSLEKSNEICRKYNSPGGCGFSGGRCKYQHRCRKCSLPGHAERDCKSA